MNILLINKNKKERDLLENFINKEYIDNKVYCVGLRRDALRILKNRTIDLFLIDLEPKDILGFDLANEIRKINDYKNKPIVFMSNGRCNILDAINKFHCYYFLLKPFNLQEIKYIIDDVSKSNINLMNDLVNIIKIDNGFSIKLKDNDIFFIEYSSRKCKMHTSKGVYTVKNKTLSNFLKELKSENIVRAHKSYAINLNNIASIERDYYKSWNVSFNDYNMTARVGYKYKDIIYMHKIV